LFPQVQIANESGPSWGRESPLPVFVFVLVVKCNT
jgi:hypothetical protein